MKIKYVINILVSKRDLNGNVYYAFQMWNTNTGQKLEGRIDFLSAPENAVWHLAGNEGEILKFETRLGKREFFKTVKNYKHFLKNEIHIEINEGRI